MPESVPTDRILTTLSSGPPLRLAVLFGSAALGEMRPDSDIDVAILPEDPDLPLSSELDLQVSLTLACRREADLVRLDRASTLLRWQVARHGVPLFAVDSFAHSRFVAAAAAEYIDFAPAFARAAAQFRLRLLGHRAEVIRDPAVTAARLSFLRGRVALARRRSAGDLASFRTDVDRQDALAMSLLVAVQDALDIAMHVASSEGWGVPASYAESFAMLSERGLLDADLARRLAGMAALRNRLAHGYATVDAERVWSELPAGLDALERFSSAIGARFKTS